MNLGNVLGLYNLFGQNMNADVPSSVGNQTSVVNKSSTNCESSYNSSDDDSSSLSSESEDETTTCENSNPHILSQRENFCFDNVRFRSDLGIVTQEIVESVIEPMLSLNEQISLVFLLYDSKNALQVILTLIAAGPEFFQRDKISAWARSQPTNWQAMLIEALAVVQNYQVLTKLGYLKEDINIRFQPSYSTTLYISKVKKMLYKTIECLTECDAKKVCNLFEFAEKFKQNYDPEYKYMEFHVLLWAEQGYITIDGSILNLEKLILHLSIIVTPEVKNIKSELESLMVHENSTYPIFDPNEVGLLIIINMEEFYREPNPKYQHLLPEEKLCSRKGSQMDVDNLVKTFTEMKFKVFVGHNVSHFDFEKTISNYIRNNFKKTHSMLLLCVLSHGNEGIVYAANSVPLPIRDIQNIVSELPVVSHLLANKPKVIIIQACQGFKRLERIVEPQKEMVGAASKNIDKALHLDGGQLTFDGPEMFYPKYGDVLTCMAIIEGYTAVRSTIKGTIYIQELCHCLRKHHRTEHFSDIITIVQKNLNEKPLHIGGERKGNCKQHPNCQIIYMTPIGYSTLTKKLFMVPSGRI